MKSSGSRTLSAFFMLVLFASIFFISCGLPKNPFYIDTILRSNNYSVPISVGTASPNFLDFSIINFDEVYTNNGIVYTNNGINLFYCYSNDDTISLSSPNNLKLINTSSFNNPQHIKTDSEEEFDLYIFQIGEDNTYSLPSVYIDDSLSNLPSGSTTLDGRILATSLDDKIYLDLSLYSATTSNLLSEGRLVQFAEFSGRKDYIDLIPGEDYDYSDSVNLSVKYYLHIFAAYYAYQPTYEIDHDSTIADTEVTYLGSVELP